ncbi:MAG: hydrogenase nickel incorporation protein HypB [Burkholderiales bacterium]|nr:hydrogenase nickel incorporation protein HypB [Burkholderiales bacterium]MDE2396430.1 hydrogenase nickel incorporation protein HypB [Burkholderiales bacterium]MDE2452861.1 hydrogenase nickel incorporation protein HypB [Burkholderiales bacterium]
MCVVCGCGENGDTGGIGGARVDAESGDLHFGAGAARVSVPGMSAERAIKLEADVLGENNRIAGHNRRHFADHGITALNLVSSPGSGKTTLLVKTIEMLRGRGVELAVIEGDQQTSNDADRIRATGAAAIQVNTGKGCHLDAPMVAAAFERLPLHGGGAAGAPRLLFIENVGNLVCPAMWDLGEAAKVVVLSVTEGEDKPLKYPDLFAAARLMVLNKIDLLPHLDFDVAACIANALRVNPGIEVLLVSARNGAGMEAWIDWLLEAAQAARHSHDPGHDPAHGAWHDPGHDHDHDHDHGPAQGADHDRPHLPGAHDHAKA